MFILEVAKNQAKLTQTEPMTSGSSNVYVIEFQFSEEWDYLEKVAVFRRGETIINVVLDSTDRCMIPWEVMTTPNTRVDVGVYGVREGNVVLPTIWANAGSMLEGVITGVEPSEPTPDVWQQILEQYRSLKDTFDALPPGGVGRDALVFNTTVVNTYTLWGDEGEDTDPAVIGTTFNKNNTNFNRMPEVGDTFTGLIIYNFCEIVEEDGKTVVKRTVINAFICSFEVTEVINAGTGPTGDLFTIVCELKSRFSIMGPPGVNGADALVNGYNTVTIEAGENVEVNQNGSTLIVSSTGGTAEPIEGDVPVKPLTFSEYNSLSTEEKNSETAYLITDDERGSGGGSSTGAGIPSGFIGMWSGTEVPTGWALCDGENGTPDLRGRFILGVSDDYTMGSTGGEEMVALTAAQLPNHAHQLKTGPGTGSFYGNYVDAPIANGKIVKNDAFVGNGQWDGLRGEAHNNMPPYYVLAFIMKL